MELRARALQALCMSEPRRKGEGLAALPHAIAHIDFDAIEKTARSISSRIAHGGEAVS